MVRDPFQDDLELNVLADDTDDQDITDAATVIIGSELAVSQIVRYMPDPLRIARGRRQELIQASPRHRQPCPAPR